MVGGYLTWSNHEYVWDVADIIPPCSPQFPHLVHEIAVLADQRHRAGQAVTSEALEEWHRYSLPSFTERCGRDCGTTVKKIISRGRPRAATPATSPKRVTAGGEIPDADVRAVQPEPDHTQSPRLGLVDLDTGEIKEL